MYREAILACLILIAVLTGCTRDHAPGIVCQSCADTVSFHKVIIPILGTYCATGSACHTGSAGAAYGISYDSAVAYAQASASGRYIIPGNADASVFYSELFPGVPKHMPYNNGVQLDPCTMQKIYCWIQQGALNN